MKFKAIAILVLLPIILMCCFFHPAYGRQASEDIVYRLKWLANTSTAGDLYADVYGIFAEAGLRVIVKPGGPERDAIKELELGRAQFGVASADQIIRALSKGARVVVVAQLFQKNPLQWIYRPDKTRIQQPFDLKGKTVGITYGGIDENIMRALLAKYDIKETELTLFSVRYDFTPFYQGKVDLWPIYRNAQGPIIGKKMMDAGEKVDYFNPDAFGIRTVANSVITSEDVFINHPQMVERFINTLLNGWELAMANENESKTLVAVSRFDRDTDMDTMREQLALTRHFIKPNADIPIGRLDESAWRETEEIMRDQKLIQKPVHIEKYLKQVNSALIHGNVSK